MFAVKDFQSHISTLNSMKQDLDYIFKRIRAIKKKLETKYPADFLSGIFIWKSSPVLKFFWFVFIDTLKATNLIRSNKSQLDLDDEDTEPAQTKENEESSVNADLIAQQEATTSDSTNWPTLIYICFFFTSQNYFCYLINTFLCDHFWNMINSIRATRLNLKAFKCLLQTKWMHSSIYIYYFCFFI